MIVWGGNDKSNYLNTGGRYNPSTDTWTATSPTNAPSARSGQTAVWSGSEMIVWGGNDSSNYFYTGGRYNPSADSWTATNTTNAPLGRHFHTAVWSGTEMIVWGGTDSSFNPFNTGGRYNSGTDSWIATDTTNAPSGRYGHTAVWIGGEMIVWGGYGFGIYSNTGARYNPGMDSWTATSTTNAPTGRAGHTAVWTGSEMIVWGGEDQNFLLLNTGGRYCAQSQAPMAQSAFSRKTHGAAGTFDVPLPLTGNVGVECRSSGATHDYSLVVTFSGNVTVTGSPQSQVTMGSGCVGSGGTCDPNGTVSVSGNMVTVPLTNIADVQVINVRINGVNGASDEPAVDVNIPMGILIGDVNGNRAVNSTDVALTKSQVGHAVDNTNFREDVNASGTITATDVTIVKSDVGHALPP
jgi:hypothetical protein